MDRTDFVKALANAYILAIPQMSEMSYYLTHIHGVASCAVLLAMKRGLDPSLAQAMGLLHDIRSIQTGDTKEHAAHGALIAESLLRDTEYYSIEEIDCVVDAIRHHSDKENVHGDYAELLKDADVLAPWLLEHPPIASLPAKRERRMRAILVELSLSCPV